MTYPEERTKKADKSLISVNTWRQSDISICIFLPVIYICVAELYVNMSRSYVMCGWTSDICKITLDTTKVMSYMIISSINNLLI